MTETPEPEPAPKPASHVLAYFEERKKQKEAEKNHTIIHLMGEFLSAFGLDKLLKRK